MDPMAIASASAFAANVFGELLATAKRILELTQDAKVKAAIGDHQTKLLELQTAHLELLGKCHALFAENAELKEQVAKLQKFLADAKRYKLITPAPGFSAYALKEDCADGEPPHWICATCLRNGKIGFLQTSQNDAFQRQFFSQSIKHLVCDCCKTTFELPVAAFDAAWGKYV